MTSIIKTSNMTNMTSIINMINTTHAPSPPTRLAVPCTTARGSTMLLLLLGAVWPAHVLSDDLVVAVEPTAAKAAEAGVEPGGEQKPRASRASKPQADDQLDTLEARGKRVLTFVREHNPELAAVLTHLERRSPTDYEAAVNDLDRSVTKLIGAQSRDPEVYEIELRVWQTRTRVDMLVAQLLASTAKNRAALETKLREAVAAELEAKAAHLGYRRQRSMAWYDRQIDRIRDDRDEMVESRVKALLREQAARQDASRTGK